MSRPAHQVFLVACLAWSSAVVGALFLYTRAAPPTPPHPLEVVRDTVICTEDMRPVCLIMTPSGTWRELRIGDTSWNHKI